MRFHLQFFRFIVVLMTLQFVPAPVWAAQSEITTAATNEDLIAEDDPMECDRIGWMFYHNDQLSNEPKLVSACQSPLLVAATCFDIRGNGSSEAQPKQGNMWVVCGVFFLNIGEDAVSLRGSSYTLVDDEGTRYDEDPAAVLSTGNYAAGDFDAHRASLYADVTNAQRGYVGFQVPTTVEFPLRLEFSHPVFPSPAEPSLIIIEEFNTLERYNAGSASSTEEAPQSSSSSTSGSALQIGDITTKDAGIGNGTIYAYVEVINNSSKLYSYVGLEGTCYSSSGSVLGTGYGNAANVAPGETVVVTMIFLSVPGCDNVKVRFDALTGLVRSRYEPGRVAAAHETIAIVTVI